MSFKIGDWVVNEFEVKQILAMEDGRVTEVSDGMFRLSGRDLDCYPLTLKTKILADHVHTCSSNLHRDYSHAGLNFPDIHRKFCELFGEGCEAILRDDEEGTRQKYAEIRKFYDSILDRMRESKGLTIGGVRLFR